MEDASLGWALPQRDKPLVLSKLGELNSTDAVYVPGTKTETEDDDMCVVYNDEGPASSPSSRICIND